MLKRRRGSSPPSPLPASYDAATDETPPRVKRVRFVAPDAWNRNARQERIGSDGMGSTEGEEVEERSQRSDDDDDDDDDDDLTNSVDDLSLEDEEDGFTTSAYASINTLLCDLNRSRTSKHERQHGTPPRPTPKPLHPTTITTSLPGDPRYRHYHQSQYGSNQSLVPCAVDASSSLWPQQHSAVTARPPPSGKGVFANDLATARKAMGKHRPVVSSPLRRQVVVQEPKLLRQEDKSKCESEAVRARYEETNRLLKSLVLSRRKSQPEDGESD